MIISWRKGLERGLGGMCRRAMLLIGRGAS
jgi:hypothetical protein